jgi:MFS transporter, CP family, cyanate transporter
MSRTTSFLIALLVVAACIRSPITGVGPLLSQIREQLSLSATAAGLLSSLPLLIFASCAPLLRLVRNHSTERLLLGAMVVLIAGILIRSSGQTAALFSGTVILASGIAVLNILLPILVKQHFPDRIPAITTAYASVMGCLAGLASGFSAPLARWLPGGWQASLASWTLPCVLALLLWLPQVRRSAHLTTAEEAPAVALPWHSALAWQVAAFMGFQSTVFYVTITWYPTMLRDAGVPVETSGWLLTVYQIAALLSGLVVPTLARRFADQRMLAVGAGSMVTLGTLGALLLPKAALLWMLVLGMGSGPGLILALSFMGLRAEGPRSAAALSLMAQSFGYLVAACGPVIFGFFHDLTAGWFWSMLFTVSLGLGMVVSGLGAGRALKYSSKTDVLRRHVGPG